MAAAHGNVHTIASTHEWESKLFEATTNGKFVIVDFTASWCGPCKMIAPIFAELSVKYPQLMFLKVDVDEQEEISKKWEIHAMPTIVLIKEGKECDRIVGFNPAALEEKVVQCVSMSQTV